MQRHLVIMARQPRYGVGKRRLAREAGDLTAWRFQRDNLAGLLRQVAGDPRWRTWLALTPAPSAGDHRWPPGMTLLGQGGGDLGRRMARLLALPPAGPVVLIGGDIPGIRARHIAQAFRALGAQDWVFGPATDGGYWLVGAARRRPLARVLFAGVRWSTPHALADSLAGCRGRVAFAATLRDVDTAADLPGAG